MQQHGGLLASTHVVTVVGGSAMPTARKAAALRVPCTRPRHAPTPVVNKTCREALHRLLGQLCGKGAQVPRGGGSAAVSERAGARGGLLAHLRQRCWAGRRSCGVDPGGRRAAAAPRRLLELLSAGGPGAGAQITTVAAVLTLELPAQQQRRLVSHMVQTQPRATAEWRTEPGGMLMTQWQRTATAEWSGGSARKRVEAAIVS